MHIVQCKSFGIKVSAKCIHVKKISISTVYKKKITQDVHTSMNNSLFEVNFHMTGQFVPSCWFKDAGITKWAVKISATCCALDQKW